MLDVLIRGGWVAAGTGNPRYPADVGIEGDRIVEVGRLDCASARRVIDAAGKVVCPGFVDAHSHSDWALFANPTAESTIRQGVTTEVVGNCGEGFAPFTELARAHLTDRLALYGYDGPITWSSFGEYLEVIRQLGTSANLAWFVGHNTLRVAAGVTGSVASEDQLRMMETFVAEAMDAGVLGMSTGLEYGAGREAQTPEIARLAKGVGSRDGYYASHIRNRDAHGVPRVAGKNFLEISELMGQEPWDCYFDIMAAAGRGLNSLIVIGRLFTERHKADMITHPLFNLAVDIWSTRSEGPLTAQTRHPLYFSGHITYLTHYVRELGLLRLEDAIRKVTSMPATHFGLRDRGLVRRGGFADVVVFDYQSLNGASTVDQPLAYARGVEHVLVNGTPVVDTGEHTAARPGRNLLRAS